eukprot:sb/3470147/
MECVYPLVLGRNRPNQEILVSDWLITSHVTSITSSDWFFTWSVGSWFWDRSDSCKDAGVFAREGMQKGLRDYGLSKSLSDGVDWVQTNLECCGVDDHLDWTKTSVAYYWVAMAGHRNDVPDSCCVDFRSGCGVDRATSGYNLWEQDCYRAVYDAVMDRGMIMGLLGVGVVVIELVAMLLSYKIREFTNEEVKKEKKRQERKSKRYANPYET